MLFSPQTAAPTWDEPIEMLFACHGKVKKFCHQLTLLPDYLAQNGLNQAACTAIAQIQTYFNQAAPLHHEDEECDFFPTLLQYAPQAQADVDELLRQHQTLHSTWAAMGAELSDLLAGKITQLSPDLIADFVGAYDKHIAIEEPLFELGRSHIPVEQRKAIGKIMAARRQPKTP